MSVSVICACGARLKARDESAGKKLKCPKCGGAVDVPAPVEATPTAKPSIRRRCPYCGKPRGAEDVSCAFCGRGFPAAGKRPTASRYGDDGDGRDLSMEAHYRAIGIWYRLSGLFCVGMAGLLLVVGGLSSGVARGGTAAFAVLLIILLGVGGLSFTIGHYLSKYSNTARIVAAILTVLSMLGNVFQITMVPSPAALLSPLIGLAIGTAYLWLFLSARAVAICGPDYSQRVADTPGLAPPTFRSPFFWGMLLLILVAAALGAFAALAATSPKPPPFYLR